MKKFHLYFIILNFSISTTFQAHTIVRKMKRWWRGYNLQWGLRDVVTIRALISNQTHRSQGQIGLIHRQRVRF